MTTLKSTSKFTHHGLSALLGLGLVAFASTAMAAGGMGLTLGKYSHDPVLGIDHIGHNSVGNPYTGDTACTAKRPVLCVRVDGSARPPYDVAPEQAFYQGWVEGHFSTTKPIPGTLLTSQAAGDAQCKKYLGPNWRMAEWHDGKYVDGMNASTHYYSTGYSASPWPASGTPPGGHSMWGYGNVRDDTRYWAAVNDNNGNCWNP